MTESTRPSVSSELRAPQARQSAGWRTDGHPDDAFLRPGRIPHIWCPGCGLGIALTAFVKALQKAKLDLDKTCVVSGIGCTGRIAGYLNLDSYHTTHGRPIPFATGLHLVNPELKVIVFSGDGDIFAIGGNHFIHAARRNMDLLVICVNNFNYGMTGGQSGPTTPVGAFTTTAPYGNYEQPFNLVYLAQACGATYVARWTTFHVHRLRDSMAEAMLKRGFRFIEIISTCPVGFGRPNKIGSGLDQMRHFKEHSVVKHGIDAREASLTMGGEIVVGKFVDSERPTFLDIYREQVEQKVAQSGGREA
jgi:2-oxoglutarate ferredoxin oxidoreductase subunit beta